MKIYISGPITGIKGYMERFEKAEKMLKEAGHIAVNPAKVNAQLPKETTHAEYMKTSLAMLEMCDTVFFLKGWEESEGCNIEFEYAYEHKHTIIFEGGRG